MNTHILTEGGFTKIPLPDQKNSKVSLYCLKDHSLEKIKRAREALLQEIEKNFHYQGNVEEFDKEIREKPYLLKEGKVLQLIKGKETHRKDRRFGHTSPNSKISIFRGKCSYRWRFRHC